MEYPSRYHSTSSPLFTSSLQLAYQNNQKHQTQVEPTFQKDQSSRAKPHELIRSVKVKYQFFENQKFIEMSNLKQKDGAMARTASTTLPRTSSTPFMRFKGLGRHDQRLNSTIRHEITPKFCQIEPNSVCWKKWKTHNFPPPWDAFKNNFRQKVEHSQASSLARVSSSAEVRIRNKIRQVEKIHSDIQRARQNNRLIVLIEDYHQKKINSFFDQLEHHLNQST